MMKRPFGISAEIFEGAF